MARKKPNIPSKEEVEEEVVVDYDDTSIPPEDDNRNYDYNTHSKDYNKSNNEDESQYSGDKRGATKQSFSDTKKKKTFQEDSSFNYADIQQNMLLLRKQQEALEIMLKKMPQQEKKSQNTKHIFEAQKDLGLGSNKLVPVHTGPKSFAKYSFGQLKNPINYDSPNERLGYGHSSNDNVQLDYGPKSLNKGMKDSYPSFIPREHSQKKGLNTNPSYYNQSNTRKDYYGSNDTYSVPKTFVTPKYYQTKKVVSHYPKDHYGNSVMWSYQHFQSARRCPFKKAWQLFRIKYMLDEKYSAFGNNEYRNKLHRTYKDGINFAIHIEVESGNELCIESFQTRVNRLEIMKSVKGYYPEDAFYKYLTCSMLHSAYCIRNGNGIELCKIPGQYVRQGELKKELKFELASIRAQLSIPSIQNQNQYDQASTALKTYGQSRPASNQDAYHNVSHDNDNYGQSRPVLNDDSTNYGQSGPAPNYDSANYEDTMKHTPRVNDFIQKFHKQFQGTGNDSYQHLKNMFVESLPYRFARLDSGDQDKKIQEAIDLFFNIAAYRDEQLRDKGQAIDDIDTDDNLKKIIKSFMKALSKNHTFDLGYWHGMNNGFVDSSTNQSMCCPCGKYSEKWRNSFCKNIPMEINSDCNKGFWNPDEFERHLIHHCKEDSEYFHLAIACYCIHVHPMPQMLTSNNLFKEYYSF